MYWLNTNIDQIEDLDDPTADKTRVYKSINTARLINRSGKFK